MTIELPLFIVLVGAAVATGFVVDKLQHAAERWSYRHDKDI